MISHNFKACARCGANCYYDSWESSLYSPRYQFTLCVPCGQKEEDAIDEAGTNDIPAILATYRKV